LPGHALSARRKPCPDGLSRIAPVFPVAADKLNHIASRIEQPIFVATREVAATVARIVEVYRALRAENEPFIDTLRRVGIEPFRAGAYALHPQAA
jgi:hypothetical protein